MAYKSSRYNVVSKEVESSVLLYNTLSNNLVLLSSSEYSNVLSGVYSDISHGLGLIIEEGVDEKELYHSMLVNEVKNDKSLGVVIAPTLSCNYSCNYCYNGIDIKNERNSRVAKALEYIESKIDHVDTLELTWYGGEPFLKINEIVETSLLLQELCQKNGVIYKEHLLTNGSLMSLHHTEKLLKMSLEYVQVSIDWPVYSSQRHTRKQTSAQALDIALSNINNIDNDIPVYIRVNLFPNSFATIELLLLKIKRKVSREVNVYFHRIHDSNDVILNEKYRGNYDYNIHDYYKNLIKARALLRDYGFSCDPLPNKSSSIGCMAQTKNHITIGYEGEIRKCIREIIGEGASIEGNVSNGRAKFYQNSIFSVDDACLECQFVPLCHGGCPKEQFEHFDKKQERCTPWKFILESELNTLIDQMEINHEN